MNYIYRLLSWLLGITIVFCILLFGWRILLNQSQEESNNKYLYDLAKYRVVDPELIHYMETKSIPLDADEVHSLTVDMTGCIMVSVDSQLRIFDSWDKEKARTELPSPCYGIADGPDGEIYLALKDSLEVYSRELLLEYQFGKMGDNARFTSIAASEKYIYVADSGNRVVWQFDLEGKLIGNIPPQSKNSDGKHFIVPSPYFDVAVNPNKPESLWVANPGRSRVEQFGSSGDALSEWGTPGMGIKEFSGCCNPNHIAITPEGNIATSEKGLPRVRIFSPDGKLISVVAAPVSFASVSQGCYSEALIKDIAVDPQNGRILVLDRETKSIRIFIKRTAN